MQSQVLPNEDPKWVEMYGHVALAGEPCEFENYSPVLRRHYKVYAYQPVPRQFAVLFMDITEHKRMEGNLCESEDRYRRLVELSPDMIAIHQQDKVVFINEAGARLLGASPEQIVGRPVTEFVPPIRREIAQERIHHLLAEGMSPLYEQKLRRLDGTEIDIEVVGILFRYQDEVAVQLVARDITARKQAEERIAQLIERLNLATRAASLGIWDWDVQKNELLWDERMYELYGIKRESFGGAYQAWLAGVHPDDRDISNEAVQRALRGEGDYDIEFRVVWPDGTVRVLKAHGLVVHDSEGKPLRMTGINYDITKRKQVETALRVNEQRYIDLLNNLNSGVVTHAPDTSILYFNKRACELLGLTPDQMLGKQAMDPQWRFLRADGAPMPLAEYPVNQVLATRQTLQNCVVGVCHTVTEKVHWVLANGLPVWDVAAQLESIIITFVDITERKQAETRIRQALAEKENLLRELYHRTKNNMQVVINMLQLQAGSITDPQALRAFRDTQDRIRAMARAHQMLYEGRDLSSINLQQYVADLAESLLTSRQMIAAGQIQLKLELQAITVLFDVAIPCGLILTELITNALEHAFPPGRAGTIHIQMYRAGEDEIVLCVADNGVGVPAGFDFSDCITLGLQIILFTVRHQLQGHIEFQAHEGVTCRVRFKDTLYTRRV
ncbi:MAG: PAS domain S-box protein [Thermoflexales bacterium]|nr:PAS domain S-box protein [Thermoflexales bacterium]